MKCLFCGFWVHKRWSNVKGPLKHNTDFKCKKCRGEVSNTNTPDIDPLDIKDEKIEKFRYFCYLGDFIGQCGGYFDAPTTRTRSAWKIFREVLSILQCMCA